MTSVEFTDQSQFNSIKLKLEEGLGRELTETEVIDYILEFGFVNSEELLNRLKVKLNDKTPSQEQLDKMMEFIVNDTEVTDISDRIDEVLYG